MGKYSAEIHIIIAPHLPTNSACRWGLRKRGDPLDRYKRRIVCLMCKAFCWTCVLCGL